ncbi:MAG: DUF4149 domain-containing protein [Candidatus Eisenbacteria bacterium]|nr:DUF4149 domain-containing protein [Candidatus Latescibacterota bacterium]MBD3303418.1 DUF4149 domain-containing protein [Candidatus Eisenbacteria bacterium]
MAREHEARSGRRGRVLAFPQVRKSSPGLTFLEFSHALVLMIWVGSLAGFALVVIPSLFTTLPSRELAARATLEILERGAFLGCGAGAFLLLTTLLMHLLSMRATRAVLAQVGLILLMTGASLSSQILLSPKLRGLLRDLPGPMETLPADHPSLAAIGRLQQVELALLLLQIVAGVAILAFVVRRWYRFLPRRQGPPSEAGGTVDPTVNPPRA